MRIKTSRGKNIVSTILLFLCCVYYFTYKFWDVRSRGFKYSVLVIIVIGIMAFVINAFMTQYLCFGKTRFFLFFVLLEFIFLTYSILAQSNSQRFLALYQYCFYTLMLLGCMHYARRAEIGKIFVFLRFLGAALTILSMYELITRNYIVPVDEWYGRVNYGDAWFLRAKVFSGSPMGYGLVMALLSLVAFDSYHKKRAVLDLGIFIVNLLGLAASFSRGPYVSFAVGLSTYILIEGKTNRKKISKYILGIIVFIAFLIIVIEIGSKYNPTLSFLKARAFSIFQWSGNSAWSSNSSRLSIWKDSIHLLFDSHNWLTGIGAAATGARTMDSGGFVTESGLLRRFVEFGIPIALFFYAFLIGLIKQGYEMSKRNKNPYLLLEISSIVCILVEDITLQITEEISITFFLWLFISLLLTYKINLRNGLSITQVTKNGA